MDLLGDPYALFFLCFWICWTLYFIFNVVLFFRNRKSFYIQTRSPWLIFSSAVGQYGMMTSLSWKIIVTPDLYPNIIDLWYLWFFIPLHFLPYPIRSLRFIFLYHMGKTVGQNAKEGEKKSFWQKLREHHKYTSDAAFLTFCWILMAIAICFGLWRQFAFPENYPGEVGSGNSVFFYVSCLVLLIVVCIFTLLGIYFMKNIKDDLKIRMELTVIVIAWIVCIASYCIAGIKDLHPKQIISIIAIVLCVISQMVTFGMPNHLAMVKPPEIANTSFDVFSFLNDRVGYKILLSFSNSSLCTESILFIREIQKYKKITDEIKLAETYEYIKENYIRTGSRLQVNIPIQMVNAVLSNEQRPSAESLDKPYMEVLKIVKTDIFPKFMRTHEAKQFVAKKKEENNQIGYSKQ